MLNQNRPRRLLWKKLRYPPHFLHRRRRHLDKTEHQYRRRHCYLGLMYPHHQQFHCHYRRRLSHQYFQALQR
jgi:hypothetical protein